MAAVATGPTAAAAAATAARRARGPTSAARRQPRGRRQPRQRRARERARVRAAGALCARVSLGRSGVLVQACVSIIVAVIVIVGFCPPLAARTSDGGHAGGVSRGRGPGGLGGGGPGGGGRGGGGAPAQAVNTHARLRRVWASGCMFLCACAVLRVPCVVARARVRLC
jgi:hypothetical protein